MKKMFFLAIVVLAFLGCSLNSLYVNPQSGFVYDPDYQSVDWGSLAGRDIPYTSFEDQGLFLVAVGNNVYFIPSAYFFENIYDHELPLRFYPSQYFCDQWGIGGYNSIWDRYYFHNYRNDYRPHYNYYSYHKNYHSNFLLHQDEFKRLKNQKGDRFKSGHSTFHSVPRFMKNNHSSNTSGNSNKKRDNH